MKLKTVDCICQFCDKIFTTKAAWVKKGSGKFCSKECSYLGKNKPKNNNVEIKCKNCNKLFKVKPYRKDTAIACSNECRKILWSTSPNRKGELHPNWKGGVSLERDKIKNTIEYKMWREDVYKKDNYTCQKCKNNTGGNLHAHHILNFSNHIELRCDVENGITLCKNCHDPSIKGSFHYIYGAKNNNREQLIEFLNS